MSETGYFDTSTGNKLAYRLLQPEQPSNWNLPLLLISGWSAVMSDWHGFADELANQGKRIVLIYDNRGVGKSTLVEGEYTIDQLANDALEISFNLLLPLSPSGFHVMGISMGGMIAQTVLQNKSYDTSLIRSAVLGCTSSGGSLYVPMKTNLFNPPAPSMTREEKTKQTLVTCYTEEWAENNSELLNEFVKLSLQQTRPIAGLMSQQRAILDFRNKETIHVEKPTLIIHGDADQVLSVQNAYKIQESLKKIPNNIVELLILPKGGHMFWDMDKQICVENINNFLSRFDAKAKI